MGFIFFLPARSGSFSPHDLVSISEYRSESYACHGDGASSRSNGSARGGTLRRSPSTPHKKRSVFLFLEREREVRRTPVPVAPFRRSSSAAAKMIGEYLGAVPRGAMAYEKTSPRPAARAPHPLDFFPFPGDVRANHFPFIAHARSRHCSPRPLQVPSSEWFSSWGGLRLLRLWEPQKEWARRTMRSASFPGSSGLST